MSERKEADIQQMDTYTLESMLANVQNLEEYEAIMQQSVVQIVELGVAMVKLQFAQFRVVQEEAAAEIINRLLCLWQEFVGDEGNVITCLAEHLREELPAFGSMGDAQRNLAPAHPEELHLHPQEADDGGNEDERTDEVYQRLDDDCHPDVILAHRIFQSEQMTLLQSDSLKYQIPYARTDPCHFRLQLHKAGCSLVFQKKMIPFHPESLFLLLFLPEFLYHIMEDDNVLQVFSRSHVRHFLILSQL